MITDTSNPLRCIAACVALIGLTAGLSGCSHMHNLWPWHHAPAAPEPATNELVVVTSQGVAAPVLAQSWHRKLFPLCRDLLGAATNPIPIKTAMKLLGRDTGELRLPMCPMDAAGEVKLRQTLQGYGLLG